MTYPAHRLAPLALLVSLVLTGCQPEPEASLDAHSGERAVYSEADRAVAERDVSYDPSGSAPEQRRLASASAQAPAAATEAAPTPDAPADLGRQLRRSADLQVSTDDYDAVLRQARALAVQFGGLVAGEQGATYGETSQTTLTLRVPSGRFDAALDALAALGTVETRRVSVDDVTGQVVDLEARLRAKRAAEARYVALLSRAGSVSEILEVQRQLDGIRAEVEVMESQARSLRGAVSLSTIQATIVGPAVAPVPPAGLWAAAAGALASGWRGLWAVVIGVLPLWPLAVVAGVALVVWRRAASPSARAAA